jgi:quercetin dioxygenase-like cupin family protein
MPIFRESSATAFATHGSRFHAYVNPTRGSRELSAWRLDVPANQAGVAHRPSKEEVLLVLSGTMTVTIDQQSDTAAAGDVVLVHAGSELRIDSGPAGCTAWVTTTRGLEAVTGDGTRIVAPWAR